MFKPSYRLIIISLLIAASWPGQTTAATQSNAALAEQQATIAAIKKALPAIVSITVSETTKQEIDGQLVSQKIRRGSGTGFIISSDGLILTNRHVVNQAGNNGEYRVRFQSGKSYYAQLIGKDPLNDLAILKIFDKNLPTIQLGNSRDLDMGTTVIAIGNALGRYQNSATKGIVSGIGRNLSASDDNGQDELLTNVIQTDAQINPGNSGGPLIDLSGRVVGINVARDASGGSIGFAIPIDDAKPVIDSVKKIGRIVRPRLGVSYLTIDDDLALEKGLPVKQGALISADDNQSAVVAGSPAERAGILPGDIILEINAQKLNEQNSLLQVVQKYKPHQKIGLKIQRGDKKIIVQATLDEFPNR